MCGNARLADVGGPGFLLPLPQKDKVHALTLSEWNTFWSYGICSDKTIQIIDKNHHQVQYVIGMIICIDTNKPVDIYLLLSVDLGSAKLYVVPVL